ncbi:hypothetical protein FMZ60_08955 [Alcaligenaceae bacterium SJ-26]|nr:hypothetical protein FMZ60_08955 [Alcaligenaceae bacterium SJ-26]
MPYTFYTAYDNDPNGFEKRVFAELKAQSIAISAALALAAKASTQGDEKALNIINVQLRTLDSREKIIPFNQQDKLHIESCLSNIFSEAKKILATEFPPKE